MLKVWKPRITFNCIAKKMQCKSEKVYLWINEGIQPGIENQLAISFISKASNKKTRNDQVLNEIKYLILVNRKKKRRRASYMYVSVK